MIALTRIFTIIITNWTSITLSTVEEVVALAVNSPSRPTPKLGNTCAGISNAKTWRKVVKIRERFREIHTEGQEDREGHFDLVFEDWGEERTGDENELEQVRKAGGLGWVLRPSGKGAKIE